jgi:hypothetical protein
MKIQGPWEDEGKSICYRNIDILEINKQKY